MKKHGLSEAASNTLLFSSVLLAALPFMLGDRLFLAVMGVMKEAPIVFDQFSTYLRGLLG